MCPDISIRPQLFRGEVAASLLSSHTFQSSWRQLYEKCPWATSGQNIDFVQTWYEVYQDQYEPVVVAQTSESELTGLLTLALLRDSRRLLVAGYPQMDYEVWLAAPESSNAFIMSAIALVQREFPKCAFMFRYLPPATPLVWVNASHPVARRCHLELRTRPLLGVAGTDRVRSSLRKKSNKSRLSRLGRLGPVRLERIISPAELERILNQVIPFYDLRQGALSGIAPFEFDRQKKSFYLAQMSKPDLLHVTVLKAGDTIVAANIGPCEKNFIGIGVLAYSPFYAQNSPGKLHLLLLAEEAAAEGFSAIDLTPDGDYKERFATDYEPIYLLKVFSTRWEMLLATVQQKAMDWVKSKLDHAGLLTHLKAARQVLRRARPALLWQKMHLYAIECTEARKFQSTKRLACNHIEHLLAFQPSAPPHQSKNFFSQALRRLENGYYVYTAIEGGQLQESAWLIKGKEKCFFPEIRQEIEFPSGSVVLFDLRLCQPALEELLCRAAEMSPARQIYLCVPGRDRSVCRQVAKAGGKLNEKMWVKISPWRGERGRMAKVTNHTHSGWLEESP